MWSKFCPKCGAAVPAEQRKKGVINFVVFEALAILVAIFLFGTIYYDRAGKISDVTANYIYGVVGLFYVILFIGYILYCLVRLTIRRPVWGIITIVIILLLVGGGYLGSVYLYQQDQYEDVPKSLNLIQDSLADAMAAKIMGDSIIAKKPTPGASMIKVKIVAELTINRLTALDVSPVLADYKQVAIDWSKALAAAAENKDLWQNLSAQPADFRLELTDKQVEELFGEGTKKIASLQEFGDAIIKRKDRDSMRYIAAKIMVQEHWLRGVIYSLKPGFFGFNLTPSALAYSYVTYGEQEKTGGVRESCTWSNVKVLGPEPGQRVGNGWCVEVVDSADQLAKAANDYAALAKEAEEWQKQWQDFLNNIPEGSKPAFEGVKGESDVDWPEIGPAVQAFYADCKAKGGREGGSGATKERLPTTEVGHTCEYKQGDKACWDYLTYSGGYYAGGSSGCPEKNLLPPETSDSSASTDPNAPGVWDGNYPVSGSLQCGGNIPNFPKTMPLNTTANVRGNKVADDQWWPINAGGGATVYVTRSAQNENGWAIASASGYYQFYRSGDVNKVSASFTVDANAMNTSTGQAYTESCSGTFSGTRQ